ncbi:YybH family protein [Kitasatospora sp. NPDC051853]|uniref:YybH family protein n=1 Tax=Kitasatospora sp. NPDC051853 TaxID=3364058 RepID=UPI0037BD416C
MTTLERDLADIRHLIAEAERHQSDPARFIPLHTPDISVVNFAGRHVQGRTTLAAAMTQALASPLAAVPTRTEIETIRLVSTDAAIVSCLKHVSDQREPALRDGPDTRLPATTGQLTYVVVRHPDPASGWLITSAQTTPVLT